MELLFLATLCAGLSTEEPNAARDVMLPPSYLVENESALDTPTLRLDPELLAESDTNAYSFSELIGDTGVLLLGAWSSALAHEAGHALTAAAIGVDFSWPSRGVGNDPFLPFWRLEPGVSAGQRRNVALGGFVFSTALEELVIHTDIFPKNDRFVYGILVYSILNAVFYVARDAISVARGNDGIGDIRDMDNGGIPRVGIYLVLLGHAAWSAANLFEDPEFY